MKTTVVTFVCVLLQSIAVAYAQDYPPDFVWNDAAIKYPFDFFDQTSDFTWTDECIEHPTNKGGSEEAYQAFGNSLVLVLNDPRLGANVEKLMLFNSNANIPMSNCTSLLEASQSITFGEVYPDLVGLDADVAMARDAFLARIGSSDNASDLSSTTDGEGIEEPVDDEVSTALPTLTLPEGGLNKCNEPIPSEFPDNIIPKEIVAGILQGLMQQFSLDELAAQMESLALYDVRVYKICTSCEEINNLWEEEKESNASEIMPYCVEGSFAYGRTMSGLLLEPIDSATKEPIVGKVATAVYNYPTETNPFVAPSQTWPLNVATNPPEELGALAAASAGTYTLVPDVIGLGEDWEGIRSYIVKSLYSASAIPLLLKAQDIVKESSSCTEMDKRVAIMGYSEGGYATVVISDAIDSLDDGYEQTYLGVGGAPIKISTEQLYMIVEGAEG